MCLLKQLEPQTATLEDDWFGSGVFTDVETKLKMVLEEFVKGRKRVCFRSPECLLVKVVCTCFAGRDGSCTPLQARKVDEETFQEIS